MLVTELPDNVLCQITGGLRSTEDLTSLALSCRTLYQYASDALYRNILVAYHNNILFPYGSSRGTVFSICEPDMLPVLLRSLQENPLLRGKVRRFRLGYDYDYFAADQVLQVAELLLEYKIKNVQYPLQYLREFQFPQGGLNFLKLMRDCTDAVLTQPPRLLYENDEFEDYYPEIQEIQKKLQIPALDSYELQDLEEIELLPTGFPINLEICLDTNSLLSTQNIPHPELPNNLRDLSIRSLEFKNSQSVEAFFTSLAIADPPIRGLEKSCFPSLKKLSLSVSRIRALKEPSRFIDLQKLEDLELRFTDSIVDMDEEAASVPFWDRILSTGIRNLSVVNLNCSNLLTNFSVGSQNIFKESNLFYSMLQHSTAFNDPDACKNVCYINFCMNNFVVLPEFSMDPEDYKSAFIVDEHYLHNKLLLFCKLFNFKNCETLVIPDYLFNWKPFLRFKGSGEILTNSNFDNTGYLFNHCNCPSCISARKILIRNAEDKSIGQGQSYYNYIVLLLFRRMPSLENNFGLDILDHPFEDSIETQGSSYMRSDLSKIFSLILDNLVPDLAMLTNRFPKLRRLCLGGFLLDIIRTADGTKISAPHDNWSRLI
ncbi:DEKNAAC105517 [Brettanomyces naardenensis]|uniref:DEKNAAC105517 n=1 Tax=Brettanomyces naardenensis TaxID=13370 RepID=A0A448YTS0_BRENA|nr:DEKNAAC105517 [Brettanomyces naardenensis]